MIISFGNKAARDTWEKDFSKNIPKNLLVRAKTLLTIMYHTDTINDLKIKGQPP